MCINIRLNILQKVIRNNIIKKVIEMTYTILM